MKSPQHNPEVLALKRQMADVNARVIQYCSTNIPATIAVDQGDSRIAKMLIAFAILLFSYKQQVNHSISEAKRNAKTIKTLIQLVRKTVSSSVDGDEIIADIQNSWALGDIGFDRLVILFKLLGVKDESAITPLLTAFLAWSKAEVEHFRNEISMAPMEEKPHPRNSELCLEVMVPPNSPPKKPHKKLGSKSSRKP